MSAEVYHCGDNNELTYLKERSKGKLLRMRSYIPHPELNHPHGCGGYENRGTSSASADQSLALRLTFTFTDTMKYG